MNLTTLGTGTLTTSRQGFGCMGLSGAYGSADRADAIRTIQHAIDLGVTLFDTADVYGRGENERIVGSALASRRDEVVIATKFGIVDEADDRETRLRADPAYVTSCCEAALERLGLEVIDLFYLHRVDPDTPIEETVGAMSDLVHSGKVRALGLSEVTSAELRKAHAVHPISAVQSEYSLWHRAVEEDVLPTMRELGVALVAFAPLGRGFLSGTIDSGADFAADDFRTQLPRFEQTNLDANRPIIEAIDAVARRIGASPAQVALAWVHDRGADVIPIPGTRRTTHLNDNVAAGAIPLDADACALLEPLSAIVRGGRYHASAINPDTAKTGTG
ncbi:MAG: aldo/keto reductase [Actinomycetia bacterium]|nr:aldo/keto reductase [Actinomycetes bacterium]